MLPIRKQIRILLRSPIFITMTLGLAALFFVVTGIQFWITEYLIRVVGAPTASVLGAFAATSATGPTVGVFFGGWFIDRLGGYKGAAGMAVTAKALLCFALCAVACALPAGFIKNFPAVIALLWLVLFWGGAIMPAATGLILSSVPASLRSFSSAMSMFMYNLLGYAAGTFFPGLLMQIVVAMKFNPIRTLAAGTRLVLIWSIFGVIFLGLAALFAERRRLKSTPASGERSRQAAASIEASIAAASNRSLASLADSSSGAAEDDDVVPEDFIESVTKADVDRESSRRLSHFGGAGALAGHFAPIVHQRLSRAASTATPGGLGSPASRNPVPSAAERSA